MVVRCANEFSLCILVTQDLSTHFWTYIDISQYEIMIIFLKFVSFCVFRVTNSLYQTWEVRFGILAWHSMGVSSLLASLYNHVNILWGSDILLALIRKIQSTNETIFYVLPFCSHDAICRFSVLCQLTISCIVEDLGLINMMLCCFSLSCIQGKGWTEFIYDCLFFTNCIV
jgi:hypothetical protein